MSDQRNMSPLHVQVGGVERIVNMKTGSGRAFKYVTNIIKEDQGD